jgi:hypothetical protein
MENAIRLAVLLPFAALAGCSGSLCDNFKAALPVAENIQTLVVDACVCVSLLVPAADAICLDEAAGYTWTHAGLLSLYNTYCPQTTAPKVAPTARPQTATEFDAAFAAAGAVRK